jgi:hypothetical protein
MNTKRIEEIQKETAYPDNISVQQALLKVWNECEQERAVKNNAVLPLVSGTLLSDYAKKKLEYINGNCIARNFPNNQPTLEWAGAVLDFLEELGLGNYR